MTDYYSMGENLKICVLIFVIQFLKLPHLSVNFRKKKYQFYGQYPDRRVSSYADCQAVVQFLRDLFHYAEK